MNAPSPNSAGMLTDLYQINMAAAHFAAGTHRREVVFDLFFRRTPCGNGYCIAAGLEQALAHVADFGFTAADLDYLRSTHPYDPAFLQHLKELRFSSEIHAVPEGTVVFPHEPLLRVRGPILECQLLETALLAIVNHQTLIATKAARVVQAAGDGGAVLEFGLRRAHGPEAGVLGARAAYIGGVAATSNVLAGQRYGIPIRGTHAHAYVQSFNSEIEAFRAFARAFPDQCVLLIDTYDTLRSGLPNAIEVFREMRGGHGERFVNFGVRLDSGDLAYLSKECRRALDEAGFADASIVASSDLDEMLIRELLSQGARIDVWGVGTNLITSSDCPALGGVYKLVAAEQDGVLAPRIKISENPAKVTNPGLKKVVRFSDRVSGRALVDLIQLDDEPIPTGPFEAFDPVYPWKRKVVRDFAAEELLVPVVIDGRRIYEAPPLEEIRRRSLAQRQRFGPEILRLINPHEYHVDLSQPLWDLKNRLIDEAAKRSSS